MKKNLILLCLLLAGCGTRDGNVTVGGMSESKYVEKTAQTIADEGLGTHTVLFRKGPWNPDMLERVIKVCRENGMTLTMDEATHRQNYGPNTGYADSLSQIVEVLQKNSDIVKGTLLLGEFAGVNFAWPASSATKGKDVMPSVSTYSEADAFVRERVSRQTAYADSVGLPRPFISIEPAPGGFSHLLRSGIDRVDVEMVFGDDTERRYASAIGATKAFGKGTYGVDNAAMWYGGEQQDELWFRRYRTSWYHAYLRGADPIYAEHGVMDYNAFGKKLTTDDPLVVRFRKELGDFASWAARNPRPEGLPRAAVAFMQGRMDGFVGSWQTHLWGQRRNDDFRIGDDERSWKIVDQCYEREGWSSRDLNGEVDLSANPPLGTVDVVPYDIPEDLLAKYEIVVFLGFNAMDDALYEKLVNYVSGGGTLLMAARHLDTADSPLEGFKPYNGGDWTELTGLKALEGSRRMKYGVKFTANPSCGWRFHMYGTACDPWFTDGGFMMPVLENHGADTLAVGADVMWQKKFPKDECLLFEHRIGDGTVVFCPSVSPVGSPELYPFYLYLVRRALESVDVYPKVECTDVVRWSCYEDGTVLLLNTEYNLKQHAVVHFGPSSSRKVRLAPGELKIVR